MEYVANSPCDTTWTYAKEGSGDGGDDFAGIDNIVCPSFIAGDGECSDGTDDCNIEDMDDDGDGRISFDEFAPEPVSSRRGRQWPGLTDCGRRA